MRKNISAPAALRRSTSPPTPPLHPLPLPLPLSVPSQPSPPVKPEKTARPSTAAPHAEPQAPARHLGTFVYPSLPFPHHTAHAPAQPPHHPHRCRPQWVPPYQPEAHKCGPRVWRDMRARWVWTRRWRRSRGCRGWWRRRRGTKRTRLGTDECRVFGCVWCPYTHWPQPFNLCRRHSAREGGQRGRGGRRRAQVLHGRVGRHLRCASRGPA